MTLLSHEKETLSETSVHVSLQERINTERSEFQHFNSMSSVSFNLNTLERPLCLADRCCHQNTLNTQTARLVIVNIAHQTFIRPACIVNKTPLISGACWNPRSQDNPTPPPVHFEELAPVLFTQMSLRTSLEEKAWSNLLTHVLRNSDWPAVPNLLSAVVQGRRRVPHCPQRFATNVTRTHPLKTVTLSSPSRAERSPRHLHSLPWRPLSRFPADSERPISA